MNGRMYDTDLRRFLSPDNYVQDPSNTQNYNRYQYGYNNPLKYSDPSGEFFFLAAVIIGAIVGAASYAVNAAITGKWSWGGFFKAIVMGGVSGAISFGIGSWTASMKGILSTVVNISAHAVASGAQSLVQGGKFLAGALAGGISAGIAKGVSAITSAAKRMSTFVKSAITTAAGGVSGGIGSVLGGGKFIDGFRQGVITAGLNHAAHKIAGKMYENRARKARVRQALMKRMYQGNGGLDGGPGDGILFKKGMSYSIKGIQKIYASYGLGPFGSSYSSLSFSYNGENIINQGFAFLDSFGFGFDFITKLKASSIFFEQTVHGNSLKDVFNQTAYFQTKSFGATLKYTYMEGLDLQKQVIWHAHFFGGGLSATLSSGYIINDGFEDE